MLLLEAAEMVSNTPDTEGGDLRGPHGEDCFIPGGHQCWASTMSQKIANILFFIAPLALPGQYHILSTFSATLFTVTPTVIRAPEAARVSCKPQRTLAKSRASTFLIKLAFVIGLHRFVQSHVRNSWV